MQSAVMHSSATAADLEVLDMLSAMPSSFPHQPHHAAGAKARPLATLNALRRPPIDPMVLAASLSSGPHVTRHHFHHAFGDQLHAHKSQQMPASQRASLAENRTKPPQPRSRRPSASGSYANCDFDDFEAPAQSPAASTSANKIEPVPDVTEEERAYYASRQAPRSVRLQRQKDVEAQRSPSGPPQAALVHDETTVEAKEQQSSKNFATAIQSGVKPHLGALPSPGILDATASVPATPLNRASVASIVRPPPIMVRCYARTRVPTPHGEVFCHLYKNNHDAKEHLALVIDPYQNNDSSNVLGGNGRPRRESESLYQSRALRSKTLDEVWGPAETDMERIVRGAYVGRLGPNFQVASKPLPRHQSRANAKTMQDDLAPLVRIHSECFTGETIGSQRCDCGEQLDEAIRLISEAFDSNTSGSSHRLGRGVVVYLRQEGRGIGLLDKLMAYNLQDMGHDTVSANVLLGHLPDARKYDIASAILRDLGVEECRLLTNNPEKMEALEAEGVRVTERVGMVPRVWKHGKSVRRRTARSSRNKNKAGKAGARSGTDSPLRPGHGAASRRGGGASSLLRQISRTGMDSSVISQADTPLDSDAELDLINAGLRHQGEDVVNASDRFDSDSEQQQHDGGSGVEDNESEDDDVQSDSSGDSYIDHVLRRSGTTMIGSSITKGPELEKYLRTKVERMGHLLDLPTTDGQPSRRQHEPATQQANHNDDGDEERERPHSQPNTDTEDS